MLTTQPCRKHTCGPRLDGSGHGMNKSEKIVMEYFDRGVPRKIIAAELNLQFSYVQTIIARFTGDDFGKGTRRKAKEGSERLLYAILAMAA
jgi:hypothetical protein